MAATKVLKLWNGRGLSCRKASDPLWQNASANGSVHAFICAASRADARRVIEEYCGRLPADVELKEYFHKGCWGDSMKGVTPERGLWLRFGDFMSSPVRVL